MGLAALGIDHLLGVAVVGRHDEDRPGLAAGGLEDPEAAVEGLDRRDRLGQLARVPDHVGVREVDHAGAEAARGEGADGLLRDLGRAHLRVEVVGRALPGRDEDPFLAGISRLHSAVEEVRDVGVLLGLREAEVRDSRAGPDIREDVGESSVAETRPAARTPSCTP